MRSWSSDVCSADLPGGGEVCTREFQFGPALHEPIARGDMTAYRALRGAAQQCLFVRVLECALIMQVIDHRRRVVRCQPCQPGVGFADDRHPRSEEHTSELQSLMRISYAVFCLKKNTSEHQYIMPI